MSHPSSDPRPAAIARVVHDPRRRSLGRGPGIAGKREFKPGDAVRSLTQITNDGLYPHRDIGESLVYRGRYRSRPRKVELSGRGLLHGRVFCPRFRGHHAWP